MAIQFDFRPCTSAGPSTFNPLKPKVWPPNLGRTLPGLPGTPDLSPKVDVSIFLPLLVNFSQKSDIFRHILVKDQNIRLVYFVSGRYNCDLKLSISPEIHVLNCILDPNPRFCTKADPILDLRYDSFDRPRSGAKRMIPARIEYSFISCFPASSNDCLLKK